LASSPRQDNTVVERRSLLGSRTASNKALHGTKHHDDTSRYAYPSDHHHALSWELVDIVDLI
jgi:hypothetical protein